MEKLTITNAFSLAMLAGEFARVTCRKVSLKQAKMLLAASTDVLSAVGHADTATIFSEQLGAVIPCNRINVKLAQDETLLVGQVVGGRLPEGTTMLPSTHSIEWWAVWLGSTKNPPDCPFRL